MLAEEEVAGAGQQQFILHQGRLGALGDTGLDVVSLDPLGQPSHTAVTVERVGAEGTETDIDIDIDIERVGAEGTKTNIDVDIERVGAERTETDIDIESVGAKGTETYIDIERVEPNINIKSSYDE